MTELLNALPARVAGDIEAILYTEAQGLNERNCKDFTTPESLKTAFENAKNRNWKLKKMNTNGNSVDI